MENKEIKPVNPKGNHSWIFSGRTSSEAKTLILWPPDVKSWLIGKNSDSGKDWEQEEEGMTEDEIVGWYPWLSGHESEQTLGDSEGQGSLVCCSPWICKESDMTEQLKQTELNWTRMCSLINQLNNPKATLKITDIYDPRQTRNFW